jgi:hypothetical protein
MFVDRFRQCTMSAILVLTHPTKGLGSYTTYYQLLKSQQVFGATTR